MQFLALSVEDLLRGLWGSLCQFFYWLIAWLYDLFINISRVEFLTSENIKPIYQRITMILTIIMVFYVTFEVVKYVIQPEEFSDKEKGASKLVLKMVLVVIMIAFVPQIFSWAYKLQNAIFDNQIFSKVILGKQTANTEEFGRTFSANILGMFYYTDQETWSQKELEEDAKCENVPCRNIVTMNLNSLVEYGEIPLMHVGLTSKGKKTDEGTGSGVNKYYIHFDGLFATIVGGFIVYMLVLYCVDAGVRVAQLAFLQIVAPIPIIGYLAPKKDGIFQKWVKQCFTTYLDLFLRVGIIYFVLLLCQILSDAYNSGTLINNIPGNASTTMKVFIYIALVMGLLMFAKKAPKMLEELFPKSGAASGNFGLKLGDRPAIARGAGMAIGAGLTGVKGLIGSTVNRAKRNYNNRENRKTDKENYKTAKDSYSAARRKRRDMNRQMRRGQYMVDEKYIDAATGQEKTRKRAATQAEIDAKKRELNREVKDRRIDRDDAKATRENSKYRFEGFSAVGGLVGGAVRGAAAGAKATDEKGIVKQVGEGLKKQDAAMAKTEKWYDEGGGSYFDRAVTSVEKSLGISTSSDNIAREVKRVEDEIKAEEVLIASESDVKAKTDTAKGRSGSKLEALEQKTKVGSGTILEYKDIYGQTQRVTVGGPNETTSSIFDKYRQDAERKKSVADEAAKAAEELKRTSSDPTKQANANALAAKAQKEAADAERMKNQMKKALEEHAITLVLQGKDTTDGTLVSQVADAKNSIELSKRNRSTIEKMREALSSKPEALSAYLTGNITTFGQLDDIQTALIGIANERTRENAMRKESKRKIEASGATAAAKADNSAAGGK